MSRRHYELPPFTTLSAFEAAARHLSFKNAAQELSVTPGAVSHQIKALEGELGVALFSREHRGVKLTPEGEALSETLVSTFRQISRQLARVRRIGDEDAVTVGSSTAVAALWLSPAIIEFWRDCPDVNVHQITQDRPFENARDFDFLVCYGKTPNPSLQHTPLYRDELVAIAAPEIAQNLQGCSLEQLAKQRLIRLDALDQTWTTWTEWFGHLGYEGDISYGARVTSYSVALQIARKSAGIALGWRRLVQPMVDTGKLSFINPHSVQAPHEFYLVGLPNQDLSNGARMLKNWLIETAQRNSA